jgi:integrase
MPRKLPPHVDFFSDRHGKPRFSFRIGHGPRTPLPNNPQSPEFQAAYAAAFAGEIAPRRKAGESAAPGSIAALIVSYTRSEGYIDRLRPTSKIGYASRLEHLRVKHGNRSVKGLSRERIITGILQPFSGRPGAALATLKILRVLIRHAINIGWLQHDPSLGIKRPKTQEIRSWTDAEIEIFERRWPIGTKQRLAFALMLYSGQRRSDVHRMTWGDVSGTMIRVVQQKTRRKLLIPLHQALRAVLSVAEREHITIINTEYGKPFSVDGFGQWLRTAITAAGLGLDCQPHGLRKTAGRRLAEAGCTAHEIMSVLGHQSLSEAERYTRDADQARLATGAFAKLEGHNSNGITQPASGSLGKIAKTKRKTT